MARMLQMLIAVCLAAGVLCTSGPISSDQSQTIEVVQENEVLDHGFFGLDDAERENTDEVSSDTEPADLVEEVPATGTTTVLPQSGRGRPSHRHHRHRGPHRRHHGHRRPRGPWTAEQKMNYVCSALQSNPSTTAGWMSQKLARLSPENREALLAVLETRKTAMRACCLLEGAERTQCVDDMTAERYERVCNNEEPLCIWSSFRQGADQSPNAVTTPSPTVTKCCEFEGTERVQCFNTERANKFSSHRFNRNNQQQTPRRWGRRDQNSE